MGPEALTQVLRDLPSYHDPRLIIGSATSDDAGVFVLGPDCALVQTVDFFTPIVDDPYLYGQIAATNSLSDVYAMGGRPLTAMNLLAVPEDLPLEVAHEILRGGADKVKEAKCMLAGGHSIKNPEPLYGLSVTGRVHPEKLISNAGARAGDHLVLTKPLGTGILSTALKRQQMAEAAMGPAVESMRMLNWVGADVAERGWVRGGTDVTGFGLLGHLLSLCRSSGVMAELHCEAIPVLSEGVIALIEAGCVPGGTQANLRYVAAEVGFAGTVSEAWRLLLADAQTSGGLLLCVADEHLAEVLAHLERSQTLCRAVIGRICSQEGEGGAKIRVV